MVFKKCVFFIDSRGTGQWSMKFQRGNSYAKKDTTIDHHGCKDAIIQSRLREEQLTYSQFVCLFVCLFVSVRDKPSEIKINLIVGVRESWQCLAIGNNLNWATDGRTKPLHTRNAWEHCILTWWWSVLRKKIRDLRTSDHFTTRIKKKTHLFIG